MQNQVLLIINAFDFQLQKYVSEDKILLMRNELWQTDSSRELVQFRHQMRILECMKEGDHNIISQFKIIAPFTYCRRSRRNYNYASYMENADKLMLWLNFLLKYEGKNLEHYIFCH